MTIKVGDRIPAVDFKELDGDSLSDVDSQALFQGRRVAIFGVPGAFTPTCSAEHVPSYLKNADALRAKGIDEIACVSVNDAWVMSAWGAAQGVGSNIRMLADGNGAFAEATGLELDASGFGLGQRSTRFSMIVDDGVVTALHVEDDPGEMASTSAEELLKDA